MRELKPVNILFVCSGNTCRSPMAQALLGKALEEKPDKIKEAKISIFSAGICALPGQPPSPEAVETMLRYKIDISGHRSRSLDITLLARADLILAMTRSQCDFLKKNFPGHVKHIFTLAEFAGQNNEDVEDPFGQDLESYQRSAIQINNCLEKILDRL